MNYAFFYISITVVLVLFFICIYFKRPELPSILIGVSTIGYSLISDITFGDRSGLFYYISRQESTLYMVLAAVTVYPPLNMIYTMFLPKGRKSVLIYTGLWIMVMLLFEYASLVTGTIVLTGWRPVPWSLVTYIVTYSWIYPLYRLLRNRMTVNVNPA